jgi:hypothetical protein
VKMRGQAGALSRQRAEDQTSWTPTGDRGWALYRPWHSDSLTKCYMRGRYCMCANRSSSRQQADDHRRRVVPSRRLQWRCGSCESREAGVPTFPASSSCRRRKRVVVLRRRQERAFHFLLWIPIPSALLRYSVPCPCTILLPLHYRTYCTFSIIIRLNTRNTPPPPSFSPAQLPHSLTSLHSNVPPIRHRTAHPGTSASLPVRASHHTPDERTAINIALAAVSRCHRAYHH